jgi:hypothetical protein
MPRHPTTPLEKLARYSGEPDANGCIPWLGPKHEAGYGIISYFFKRYRAHRVAFEVAGRKLIAGLVLDHTCRNRACVNADHLRQVTIGDNVRAGDAGKWKRRKGEL